jgi:hypothetical protein
LEIKDKRKLLEEYNNMKFFAVLSLFASLLIAGCGGGTPANNANTNANAKTPAPVNAMAGQNDADTKKKIEDAWKAKGCTGASVEVKDGVATARGTVPKGKLGECVMAAQEQKPGQFKNELAEAK